MKVDLWKMYKKFYQRSHRDQGDFIKEEMTKIAHEIATANLSTEEMLFKAYELLEFKSNDNFTKELISAIEEDNYEINIPHSKSHLYQTAGMNLNGFIYIFTSESRPNQSKLGATFSHPITRSNQISARYGYKVKVFFSKYVTNPFRVERNIQKLILDRRVKSNAYGDSIEWYAIAPKELKILIESLGVLEVSDDELVV